jgi:transcription elongation factor Elf1
MERGTMSTCPRCNTPIPADARCALSRHDNETMICSSCGVNEAMWMQRRHEAGLSTVLPPFDAPLVWP